jgi:hypothetical protein
MNPVDPSAVALKLPARVEGLEHESLYSTWTTHCLMHQLEPRELLSARVLSRPIFGWLVHPEEDMAEIAKAIGVPMVQLQRLRGCDISGALLHSPKLLHPSLRYCKQCLAIGYHSIVCQHIAIARCPLHNVPLTDMCPECGRPIEPTFGSVLVNPFECPVCGAPLANTVAGKADQQHARWADQMLGARRSVLAKGVDVAHQNRRLSDLPIGMRSPANPAASRHYQRVSIWALPHDPQWICFREQVHAVGAGHERGSLSLSQESVMLESAANSVLKWLMQACWCHENAAMRLLGRLGRYPRGLRLNAQTSVISVALYKLAAAYDLLPEMRILYESRDIGTSEQSYSGCGKHTMRYGDRLTEHPKMDARLLQLEMLSLFAKLLVRQPTNSYLDQVNWLDYPHPVEFAPSWRVEKGGAGPVARVRYRAAEVEVERLIKRTWFDVLRFRHKDAVGEDLMWKDNHLDIMWHEIRLRPPATSFSDVIGVIRQT